MIDFQDKEYTVQQFQKFFYSEDRGLREEAYHIQQKRVDKETDKINNIFKKMFEQSSYSEQYTFFQKLRSFDFVLIFCVLCLGIISNFSMYSTDGGEFLYHSKSHFIRFVTLRIGPIIIYQL